MEIKQRATELMKAKGWTQEKLADAVGIHPITLCRLLNNPRRPESAYDKLLSFLEKEQRAERRHDG